MKKAILLTGLSAVAIQSWACAVCERNQPRLLKGITHGAGPDSQWDYLIVSVMIVIVIATLFFSVKWLIKPGEQSKDHIKRFILNNP